MCWVGIIILKRGFCKDGKPFCSERFIVWNKTKIPKDVNNCDILYLKLLVVMQHKIT